MTRRLLVVVVVCAAGACRKPKQGGIEVDVVVASTTKADCVSVTATSGDVTLSTAKVHRKSELAFAVAAGNGLTGDTRFTAHGWLGPCDDDAKLVLNVDSEPLNATFGSGVAKDPLVLHLDGALDDSDHDGFRARDAGGTDCDDGTAAVAPGLDELCTDGLDNDCNGKADCADTPRCDGVGCSDGQSCTMQDRCMNGTCSGDAPSCTPPSVCFRAAGCSDDAGCVFFVDAGTPCDGGACRPDGTCAPAGTEFDCTNGADDDGDLLVDCFDLADCVARGCTSTNLCSVQNVCQPDAGCAGVPRDCTGTTASCLVADAGACSLANGQCFWPARTGSCDDALACTTTDACLSDGGCAGAAVTCSMADDGGCFQLAGTCVEPSGKCVFAARPGGSCDDAVACSAADVCLPDGGCGGATYTCPTPPVCMGSGACEGDGGCRFVVTPGAPCAGGTCLSDAGCDVAVWPYPPSNFLPAQIPDSGIGPALVIDCAATFDSNALAFTVACPTQAVVTALQLQQDGGPDVALLALYGLTIGDAGSLRLVGDRPVIFAVFGDVLVRGELLANSQSDSGIPGAGGYRVANRAAECGARAGGDGPAWDAGGGGGGGALGTNGGSGGAAFTALGGDAGVARAVGFVLVPLMGGCPGGMGGGYVGGLGTPGGGAVQLSSTSRVTIDGVVSVSGGGGGHGQGDSSGGGGAGSGGAILLEAPVVVLGATARITANGGGGGEGGGVGVFSAHGEDGALYSAMAARGGDGIAPTGGAGGSGATIDAGATDGEYASDGGGGGGGGLGRLRVNGYPSCSRAALTIISAQLTRNGCN